MVIFYNSYNYIGSMNAEKSMESMVSDHCTTLIEHIITITTPRFDFP